VECLPAYAPELNPDAGVWAQLKGVELRDAVKRVRRKPRILQGCVSGATLEIVRQRSEIPTPTT
jgi:hypothetical protein